MPRRGEIPGIIHLSSSMMAKREPVGTLGQIQVRLATDSPSPGLRILFSTQEWRKRVASTSLGLARAAASSRAAPCWLQKSFKATSKPMYLPSNDSDAHRVRLTSGSQQILLAEKPQPKPLLVGYQWKEDEYSFYHFVAHAFEAARPQGWLTRPGGQSPITVFPHQNGHKIIPPEFFPRRSRRRVARVRRSHAFRGRGGGGRGRACTRRVFVGVVKIPFETSQPVALIFM